LHVDDEKSALLGIERTACHFGVVGFGWDGGSGESFGAWHG